MSKFAPDSRGGVDRVTHFVPRRKDFFSDYHGSKAFVSGAVYVYAPLTTTQLTG